MAAARILTEARRLLLAVVATAGLVASTVTPSAAAPGGHGAGPHLPQAAHGSSALTALGTQLPAAAQRNGMSATALRELLTNDPTMWLDRDADLYVADVSPQVAAAESGTATGSAFSPVAPLADTFRLHSQTAPGATKIFLDFNGVTLGPSAWGWQQRAYAGYDTDGDPRTFGDDERIAVQEVWARVAEDYAPFFVDVTTEDPGPQALTRSSTADTAFGIRVAVTDDPGARPQLAGCETGCDVIGIAYVGAFDRVTSTTEGYGPVWVFAGAFGNDTRMIAEVASHEVGHTLNLQHSPLPSSDLWGAIMNPYATSAPVTQWVNALGVDEQAVIAAHGAPLVVDEPGTGPATAPAYAPGTTGVIAGPADTDWYALQGCPAGSTVDAEPADQAPNLDLKMTLIDAAGATVASRAPQTRVGSGMGATVTVPSGDGSTPWYIVVDGVGSGTDGVDQPIPYGYGDYGSVGRYSLDVVGCALAPAAPSSPRHVVASSASSTTVSWDAPSSTGGAGLSGLRYDVALDDGSWTDVGAATTTVWDVGASVSAGHHVARVRAVNAAGPGPEATVTFTRSAPPDTSPPNVWPTVAGIKGDNGWYVSDVVVSWTVEDAGSGVRSQRGCDTQTLSSDTDGTELTCEAIDGTGLVTIRSVTVKRDATAPTLMATASPAVVAQGGTVVVDPAAQDATSGVDTTRTGCAAVGTGAVGSFSATCTATDAAGNAATAAATFTVVNAFLGFQAPLTASTTVKLGSTLPVKFTLGDVSGTTRSGSADVEVRLTTAPDGAGTALAQMPCTYSAKASAYQCDLKTSAWPSRGSKVYVTVLQRVPAGTGDWFVLPDGQEVTSRNSAEVTTR